jgi:hypothetical protein
MMNGQKSYTKGEAMHVDSLDVLCDFMTKSWGKVKVETVIKSLKKCGISNAMDGTEDNSLWDTDDKVETDSPDTEWDPYDNVVDSESQDVLELFASDDKCDDFAGF